MTKTLDPKIFIESALANSISPTADCSIIGNRDQKVFVATIGDLRATGATAMEALNAVEVKAATIQNFLKSSEVTVQRDEKRGVFVAEIGGVIRAEGNTRDKALAELTQMIIEKYK